MRWGRFGVPIAIIVFLFALGRISSVVIDWAWFSSIGYVGVFWTAFVTKAAFFVVVFAVSTLLLWANATLAVRFASGPLLPGSAAFGPCAAVRALPGSPGLALSPLMWRLLILAVALVLALLIAMGESGRWDLILRFIYQAPFGRNDPLFDKDIGFYIFSLPLYVALRIGCCGSSSGYTHRGRNLLRARRHQFRYSALAFFVTRIAHGSALLGLYFAVQAWAYAWTVSHAL